MILLPAALDEASRVLRNTRGWACPALDCRNAPAYLSIRDPGQHNWWLQTPCNDHAPHNAETYLLIPITEVRK